MLSMQTWFPLLSVTSTEWLPAELQQQQQQPHMLPYSSDRTSQEAGHRISLDLKSTWGLDWEVTIPDPSSVSTKLIGFSRDGCFQPSELFSTPLHPQMVVSWYQKTLRIFWILSVFRVYGESGTLATFSKGFQETFKSGQLYLYSTFRKTAEFTQIA